MSYPMSESRERPGYSRRPRGERLPSMRTRLVLADDHPIVLHGLENLLRAEPDLQVVARCASGDETIIAVRRHRPDLLILDLHMPRRTGLDVLRQLRRDKLGTKVIIMADRLEDDEVLEAYRLGVRGMLLKELALKMVVQCVRKVLAGEIWFEKRAVSRAIDVLLHRENGERETAALLTPREMEMVRLVAQGLRTEEMSSRLDISVGTIKTHLHRVYRKLKINNRVALTLYAQALKLV
jgi:two-component system, NarL family, nitrate/nitrite response regulator NarL